MSFRKEDHISEPEVDCMGCGDTYPITDLDERGFCHLCRVSEDEEDYSDG